MIIIFLKIINYKKKFGQQLRKHFLPKLKILSKLNNLDLALEECVKKNDFYPNLITTKKTILKKKNIEIRDYLFEKEVVINLLNIFYMHRNLEKNSLYYYPIYILFQY